MIGHSTRHQIRCDVCQDVFSTAGLLQTHKKNMHNKQERLATKPQMNKYTMKCSLCDFLAINKDQLHKHIKTSHESNERTQKNKECRYWMQGNCFRGHECKFSHPNIIPCRYQERCLNFQLKFSNFLEFGPHQVPHLNSYQDFPPLNRNVGLRGFW